MHIGIVTFWPLFYGLTDDEKVLSNLFDLLEDKERMLSEHGVRSLSALDQFYMLDSSTYRGNLFVHLHYMLLRGLKTYYCEGSVSMVDKPELAKRADALYLMIKERIVNTVQSQWQKDHLFYEMYHPDSGEGLGTAPFNGWTSLIVLIANDLYH